MKILNIYRIVILILLFSNFLHPSLFAQDGLFAPKKNTPILKAPEPKNLQDAKKLFVSNYVYIARATHESSLNQAIVLEKSIKAFLRSPSKETHRLAKISWIQARFPYLQGEVFRNLGLSASDKKRIISSLNGWPIKPGTIDYTVDDPISGIVPNSKSYPKIDKNLILQLNQDNENFVISSGYHVIEFLLWGEDNQIDGSGDRPFADYDQSQNPLAKRRASYLMNSVEFLVNKLGEEVAEWKEGDNNNLLGQINKMPLNDSIAVILKRVKKLSDSISSKQIDRLLVENAEFIEQSSFSDSTHFDFLHSAAGISNLFAGAYVGLDGKLKVLGLGLIGLAEKIPEAKSSELRSTINGVMRNAQAFKGPFDALALEDKEAQAYIRTRAAVTELSKSLKLLSLRIDNLSKIIN